MTREFEEWYELNSIWLPDSGAMMFDVWNSILKFTSSSRTCDSCKWLKERNPYTKPIVPRHACTHADVIYMCRDTDFCCNKYEVKDK